MIFSIVIDECVLKLQAQSSADGSNIYYCPYCRIEVNGNEKFYQSLPKKVVVLRKIIIFPLYEMFLNIFMREIIKN